MKIAKCEIIEPAKKDACGLEAKFVVSFNDGSTAFACDDCCLRLSMLAQEHKCLVHFVKLDYETVCKCGHSQGAHHSGKGACWPSIDGSIKCDCKAFRK